MATINVRHQADVTINGEVKQMGSITTADTITVTDISDMTVTIASAATRIMWETATQGFPKEITDFDFLYVESDVAASLQLTADSADAGGGERQNYIALAAGIPFILASDANFGDDDSGTFDGTTDLIDKISIKATGGAAVVRFVIAT